MNKQRSPRVVGITKYYNYYQVHLGYGMGRSDAALFAQQQTANEKSSEIVQCFFVLRVYMSRRA